MAAGRRASRGLAGARKEDPARTVAVVIVSILIKENGATH